MELYRVYRGTKKIGFVEWKIKTIASRDGCSPVEFYASIAWYWLENDGGTYFLRFFSDSSLSCCSSGDSLEFWNDAAASCE